MEFILFWGLLLAKLTLLKNKQMDSSISSKLFSLQVQQGTCPIDPVLTHERAGIPGENGILNGKTAFTHVNQNQAIFCNITVSFVLFHL
jgi:hypothetical protein